MAVSVRISGKRGKVVVESKDATTVGEAVAYAAQVLGLVDYDVTSAKLLVEGSDDTVTPDTPLKDGTKIDSVPAARLG